MSARKLDGPFGWRWTGYTKKVACEVCGAQPPSRNLVVHHKDRNKANNADHANLETLCRSCHVREHAAELAESQRRPDVNARRGAAISKARTGKHYAEAAAATRANWQGAYGARLRAKHTSVETREKHSRVAQALMRDPVHLAKRKAMKEARNGT